MPITYANSYFLIAYNKQIAIFNNKPRYFIHKIVSCKG